MAFTFIAWFIAYVGGALMAFVHPIYGLLAYFLTYYQTPQFRWWGKTIRITFRALVNDDLACVAGWVFLGTP